jgi:hypothetical protein
LAKTAVTGKAAKAEPIVSYEMMSVILRAWQDWVWGGYRGKACAIKAVAEEIALTRQGLTKVLRRKGDSKFTTFLKTCFLKPGTEGGITGGGGGLEIRAAVAGRTKQRQLPMRRSKTGVKDRPCHRNR